MMLSTGRPRRFARYSGSSGAEYGEMLAMHSRGAERICSGTVVIELPQADVDRFGVRVQSLSVGNSDRRGTESPHVVGSKRVHRGDFQEVVKVQGRGEARC